MTGRQLTLTTIGLSIRDEMRVKSMLQLVEGKTVATWTYVEEAAADLAICEPESTLARAVMRQATQRGRPRCVSLVRQGVTPPQDAESVSAPLRVSDFISMLDATLASAGDVDTSLTTQELVAAAQAEAVAQNEGFVLAHALRDIVAKESQRTHLIKRGDLLIYLLPSQATVFANQDLSPELISELAHTSSALDVTELKPDEALPEGELRRHSLQYLLWNCGQLGTTTDLLPWLPRMARFRLHRWPDFGRLGHKTWQVRLTSILINNAYTLQQMTNIAGQPVANIRGFLNACSLCGLLTHEALATEVSESAQPTEPAAEPTSRWSDILRSIRNALHIGDQ